MAHLPIDITTHLLLALYPAALIFLIEIACRYVRVLPYKKYILQGAASLSFAVAYIVVIDAMGIAIILSILAPVLFIHAKRVKQNPTIR